MTSHCSLAECNNWYFLLSCELCGKATTLTKIQWQRFFNIFAVSECKFFLIVSLTNIILAKNIARLNEAEFTRNLDHTKTL